MTTASKAKEQGNTIKHVLRTKHGLTLKGLAEQNNWKYRDVSDTVRGIRFGYFGTGREVAEKIKELTGIQLQQQSN